MAEAYIGEVRMFCTGYTPVGWLDANGQTLDIDDYPALYALIGTTFGGDGVTEFMLPDLRSRAPIHIGQGAGLTEYALGDDGGAENVTLEASEIPAHTHPAEAHAKADTATQTTPTDHYHAEPLRASYHTEEDTTMADDSVQVLANTGGGDPHENRPPYLALRFCICFEGLYPLTS